MIIQTDQVIMSTLTTLCKIKEYPLGISYLSFKYAIIIEYLDQVLKYSGT